MFNLSVSLICLELARDYKLPTWLTHKDTITRTCALNFDSTVNVTAYDEGKKITIIRIQLKGTLELKSNLFL